MQKVISYCDYCTAKMSDEEYAASIVRLQTSIQAGEVDVTSADGIFCSTCLPYAPDYWRSRSELMAKVLSEAKIRLERHRRSFFQSASARKNLKVVQDESRKVS